MSTFDKIVAAFTPPESAEKRTEAREAARAAAEPGDWLSLILDHHERVEQAFAEVKTATNPEARRAAQKALAVILTGHSIAEEAVIYPALAQIGKTMSAETAYTEQAAAKMQTAALDHLDPESEDYLDKLGHLEGAVAHHVYKEESEWFLELKTQAPAADQDQITARYQEEFERYMGADAAEGSSLRRAAEPRSFSAEL